jgi:rare lipoprotein A (peptidoglycan hydrolase)
MRIGMRSSRRHADPRPATRRGEFIARSAGCNEAPDVLCELAQEDNALAPAMINLKFPRWMLVSGALALAGCGSSSEPHPHFKIGSPYKINGRWYHPRWVTEYDAVGVASWYGEDYHGRYTANGEIYDMYALTAAHPTLPLPSVVRVTNLVNGRSLILRVNDRGPFVDGRLIDLSYAAADELGFVRQGLAQVQVSYLGLARLDEAPIRPGERRQYVALSCDLPAPDVLDC